MAPDKSMGIIEGVSEAITALFRVISGRLSDYVSKRKPFVVFGYTLSGLTRPLVAFAGSWWFVFWIRLFDRVGKGLRTSPRDALIADVTPSQSLAFAYGVHRAMDHFGAVLGPLVAAFLIGVLNFSITSVFKLALIPSLLTIYLLVFKLREPKVSTPHDPVIQTKVTLAKDLKKFFIPVSIFTLSQASDIYLLAHLAKVGFSTSTLAILWSIHHVIKSVSSHLGGKIADQWGKKKTLLVGWFFYALIYAAFGKIQSPTLLLMVFLIYGIYFGLVEPAEKALIASMSDPQHKGHAFGWFSMITGLLLLPANLLFSFLYDSKHPSLAFYVSSLFALLACLLLFVLFHQKKRRP